MFDRSAVLTPDFKCPLTPISGTLNAKNLASELKYVANWYQLGIKLGLRPDRLRQIEMEHPGDIERYQLELVDLWLQNTPCASWRQIITALRELGELTTADRIEQEYVKEARGITVCL